MQIFRHTENLPAAARGAVVAIGNFDGVHRGHQTVVAAARAEANRLGVPVCVLSFEPHPRSLFRPDDPPFRLTPFRIKARLLEDLLAQIKPGTNPPPFEDWSVVELPWPDDDWSDIAPSDEEWEAWKKTCENRTAEMTAAKKGTSDKRAAEKRSATIRRQKPA